MRITEKLNNVRQRILNGDVTLADDIAADGIAAIFAGINSDKWQILMKNFAADGSPELERLCGRDTDFNNSRWGMACLAYIAGNSICTATTAAATGTIRGMDSAMILNLDAGAGAGGAGEAEQTSLAIFNDEPTASAVAAFNAAREASTAARADSTVDANDKEQ